MTNPEDIIKQPEVFDFNNYLYFGTIGRSMYTLFSVSIMVEWPEFGRAILEKQPLMFIFFILFIIFTGFGVTNVIIGVIVDNTMEAAKEMEREKQQSRKA